MPNIISKGCEKLLLEYSTSVEDNSSWQIFFCKTGRNYTFDIARGRKEISRRVMHRDENYLISLGNLPLPEISSHTCLFRRHYFCTFCIYIRNFSTVGQKDSRHYWAQLANYFTNLFLVYQLYVYMIKFVIVLKQWIISRKVWDRKNLRKNFQENYHRIFTLNSVLRIGDR